MNEKEKKEGIQWTAINVLTHHVDCFKPCMTERTVHN